MKLNRKKCLVLLGLVLFISTTLPILTACEPSFKIKIENNTEQALTIYYDVCRTGVLVSLGDLEPGEHIYTPNFWLNDGYYQIDAKTVDSEVIFSKEFSWFELRDMDCEVVITPPED